MPSAMKGRKSRAEIFKVTGIKNFHSQWWVGLESGEDVSGSDLEGFYAKQKKRLRGKRFTITPLPNGFRCTYSEFFFLYYLLGYPIGMTHKGV